LEPLCVAGEANAELVAQHVAVLAALGRREEGVALYRRKLAASPGDLTADQALAMALEGAISARGGKRVSPSIP